MEMIGQVPEYAQSEHYPAKQTLLANTPLRAAFVSSLRCAPLVFARFPALLKA